MKNSSLFAIYFKKNNKNLKIFEYYDNWISILQAC